MKVPLFSEKEQAQFFKVIREINRHLHHTKQYDKADEVLKQLNEFGEQIKTVAPKVQELFKIAFKEPKNSKDKEGDILEKNKRDCLKNCIDKYLRSRMPFDDQIEGIIQEWDSGQYTFYNRIGEDGPYIYREPESIEGKMVYPLKVAEKVKELDKDAIDIRKQIREVFGEVRSSRLKAIDTIEIIITKLLEIQKERETYQILLDETLKERNTIIYGKIKEVKKALFHLEEKKIDALFSEDTYSEEHLQYISNFITAMNTLKVALNDLYIEKNKLRGFVPFYPAFRAELFKKRAENVRKPLKEDRIVRENETINEIENLNFRFEKYGNQEKILLSGWQEDIEHINNEISKVEPTDNIGDNLDESKRICVKARLNRIIYNLLFNPQAFKRFEEDLKILMNKLEKYDSGFDKSWEYLVEKAFHIKQSTGDKSNKEDLDNPYIQLSIIAENANFDALLEHLNILRGRFIKVIIQGKKKYDVKDVTLSNRAIENMVTLIFKEERKSFIELLELFIKKSPEIRDNIENEVINFKSGIDALVNETKYFFNCVKGHLKKLNSRVHSRIPTEYEPFSLRNDTLKNLLKDEKHRFSSKFRNLIYKFDSFLEEGFEKVILEYKEGNDKLEPFNRLKRDFQQQLEEVTIGRYNVLNEYLHSNSFINVSDTLQIYGASFAIWNQADKQLVRFQDRRYMYKEFRPSQFNPINKWFDLPERSFDGKSWKPNRYEESIDLMYLSKTNQVSSQFLEQFGEQNNLLNLVEKSDNFLFCEDGEISAFCLAYRMLNSFVHTDISFNEISEIVNSSFEEKLGDLERNKNKILTGRFRKKRQKIRIIKETKPFLKSLKSIVKRGKDKPDSYPIISIIILILNRITNIEKQLNTKNFDIHKSSKQNINQGEKLIKDQKKYHNLLVKIINKVLLKNYSLPKEKQSISDSYNDYKKQPGRIKFDKKQIEDKEFINELAYDKVEARARIEKFYNELEVRLNDSIADYSQEFYTQGLITDTISQDSKYVDVTERYINLCRFIIKEIKPDSYVGLKVRSDIEDKYLKPDNEHKYFIDKRLARYDGTDFSNYKYMNISNAEQIKKDRQNYLGIIQNKLIRVANQEKVYTVDKKVFYDQLSNIIALLFEPISKFLADNHEEYIKQKPDDIWKSIKPYMDKLFKFPISASFLWRANSSYALSQLVIPMAPTSVVKASLSNVGFLILGIRNVYKNNNSDIVHITYDTQEYLKELIFTLRTVFSPLMQPLMDTVFYGGIVKRGIEEDAKLAAASQVMARNLSHNIGSHVLANLSDRKNLIRNIKGILKIRGEKTDDPIKIRNVFTDLLNYIRERMDLIADISTSAPQFTTSKPFRSTLKGIATPLIKNENEKKDEYGSGDLIFRLITGIENEKNELIKFNFDIQEGMYVSFAHDNLGVQALFVIVENVIRNIFKHDERKIKYLTLNIASSKIEDNFIPVILTLNPTYEGSNGNASIKRVVDRINTIIKSPMLEEKTGRLRADNWGILEMKIAAAYLRRQDIIRIDNKYDPPLLGVDTCEQTQSLRYTLYLEKPRTVLFVLENEFMNKSLEKYETKGIKVLNENKFKDEYVLEEVTHKSKIPETDYDFLVTQNKDNSSNYSPYQRQINLTKLLNQQTLENFLDSDEWEEKLWEIWAESFGTEVKIEVIKGMNKVQYEKDSNDSTIVVVNGNRYKPQDLAIFDDHGKNIEHILKNENDENILKFYFSFHSIHNNYTNKIIADYNTPPSIEKYKLTEMINYSIAVVDERVQSFASRDKEINNKKVSIFETLRLSGIYVPKEFKLNQKLHTDDIKSISDWITNTNKETPLDAIIIHVGIIEMLYASSRNCIEDFEKDFNKNGDLFFIYTSGRGLPSRVPHGKYFLSNSTVLKYLFPLDKLSLVNVIYSLRKVERPTI